MTAALMFLLLIVVAGIARRSGQQAARAEMRRQLDEYPGVSGTVRSARRRRKRSGSICRRHHRAGPCPRRSSACCSLAGCVMFAAIAPLPVLLP